DEVVAGIAAQEIVALAAVKRVVVLVALGVVVARAGLDQVVAGAAIGAVVALQRMDGVVAAEGIDLVVVRAGIGQDGVVVVDHVAVGVDIAGADQVAAAGAPDQPVRGGARQLDLLDPGEGDGAAVAA